MKIIGMDGSGNYIAVVSHTELEKSADLYYNKLGKLKVGDEYDLAAGYDFRYSIESVCKNMTDTMKRFGDTQKTLFQFAQMINSQSEEKDQAAS